MYSQIYLLEIKNPLSDYKHSRKYIIDYSGNDQPEDIVKKIRKHIKKHKTFYSDEFELNDMSGIYYLPDIDTIKVEIPESEMEVSKL